VARLGSPGSRRYTGAMKPPNSSRHGASHGGPPRGGPDRGPARSGPSKPGPSPGRQGFGKPSQSFGGQAKPAHAKPPHGQGQGHGDGRPRDTTLHVPRPQAHGNSPQQIRRDHQPTPPRGAPDAPRGTVWLYGLHAAAAALVNPARRLRRLLLTEDAETALRERVPPPWSIPQERTDRGRLDQLLGRDVVHQGIALLADLLPAAGLAQTLQRPGPIVVLDQVSDPRNVGAILRSAAAFGAAGVVTQDRNAPEETGALAKAASGALETMPLLRAVNIARTLIALKAAECWVIGLDAAATAPLSGVALGGRRVALVLGAEGSGLRRLTRETCDELVGLATPGAMESLNVSAAAAIALYELTRRP
jgi:23S rRNA (guanosine2251-2'-O)-methyltransferase